MRADMQRGRLRFQAGDSLTNGTWTDGGSASGAGDGGKLARMRAGAEIIDCRSELAGCWDPAAVFAMLSPGFGHWLPPVGSSPESQLPCGCCLQAGASRGSCW